MFKVLTIVGTRPELIKLSAVIGELDRNTNHILVHTGQNFDYELNAIFFKELGIRKPDHYLEAAGGSAAETIAHVIERADKVLSETRPDAVLIYGDTNSSLSAIVAKRRRIPIFHMEAGNRCFDMRVPEEINRRIVDHLSDINMTITEHARRYLLHEGLKPETVICVGSCMPEILARHRAPIEKSEILKTLNIQAQEYFVVSAHREENVDDPYQFSSLIETLKALTAQFHLPIIFSTHPRTRKKLEDAGVAALPGVHFLKPLGFFDYVALQKAAFCVLSDSGTITEEAGILQFPAVTIRDAHERPEGMDSGVLVMSALNPERVVDAVNLVTNQAKQGYASAPVEAYQSTNVSGKVVRIILSYIDYIQRTTWSKSNREPQPFQ